MLAPGWDLFDRFLGLSDFSPFEINLKWNPEDPLTWGQDYLILSWRWYQVSNLESCPNQLSKFGYHQTTDSLLTDSWDSWLSPDWHLTDFWLTTDWLLTDFWLSPDWFPFDFWQTHIKPSNRDWRWHRVPIWRAVWISSPNLVTIRRQRDYRQTPD